ncbi:hypothetical protein AVEN_30050-1 [Araneus ventricosus]|uniref:Uncharacterized protein n=1 Tax=Araneus ventricosus TaxID=182803 RepID=A0A4Y2I6V4_ARAVE|nr:hypothetical protein AVEN_30050-1 [Araneus ventricosus]
MLKFPIVGEDLTPLSLPQAVKEDGKLVEVSGDELRKAQRGCSTLKACFLQAEFRVEGGFCLESRKTILGALAYKWRFLKFIETRFWPCVMRGLRRTSV